MITKRSMTSVLLAAFVMLCCAGTMMVTAPPLAVPPSDCNQCRSDRNCDRFCGKNGGKCFEVSRHCHQCACYAP